MGSILSIIIPTLNEESELGATLDRVETAWATCARSPSALCFESLDLIVVDSGSHDRTPSIAASHGARVFSTPRIGRGGQMNAGAARADGSWLWFLHADTWIESGCLRSLAAASADSTLVGGGFYRRFRGGHLLLRATCALAGVRNRLFGWHLGDQGIFCRSEAFLATGGYRPVARFEDLDFSRRLGRCGRLTTLGPPVLSSARRFALKGAVGQTWSDLLLTLRYMRGLEGVPFRLNQRSNRE